MLMKITHTMYPHCYYIHHHNREGYDATDPAKANAYLIFHLTLNLTEALSGKNQICCGLPQVFIKAFYDKSKSTHYQDEYVIEIAMVDNDDLDYSAEFHVANTTEQKRIFKELVNFVYDRRYEIIDHPYSYLDDVLKPYVDSLLKT